MRNSERFQEKISFLQKLPLAILLARGFLLHFYRKVRRCEAYHSSASANNELHHNIHPPLVRRTPQPYKSGRLGECLLELLSSMVMGVEQVVCLLTARLLQISLIQFLDDRILVRLSYEAFVIALVQRFCSLRA